MKIPINQRREYSCVSISNLLLVGSFQTVALIFLQTLIFSLLLKYLLILAADFDATAELKSFSFLLCYATHHVLSNAVA